MDFDDATELLPLLIAATVTFGYQLASQFMSLETERMFGLVLMVSGFAKLAFLGMWRS